MELMSDGIAFDVHQLMSSLIAYAALFRTVDLHHVTTYTATQMTSCCECVGLGSCVPDDIDV